MMAWPRVMLWEFPGKPRKKRVKALESPLSSSPSILHPLARAELGEAGLEPGAVPVASTVDLFPTSGSGPSTGRRSMRSTLQLLCTAGKGEGMCLLCLRVLPPKISTVLVTARKEEDPPSLKTSRGQQWACFHSFHVEEGDKFCPNYSLSI